jgi:hypothetical protein
MVRRFSFWREVLLRPIIWLVFAPAGILGIAYLFVLVRDEFMPAKYHEAWRLLNLLRFIAWYWWIIATLLILTVITMEGAFRHYLRAIVDERAKPSPENSQERFQQQRRSALEMQELNARKQLAEEQLQQIRNAKSKITMSTDPPPAPSSDPPPFIAVEYHSEWKTFVDSNEEEVEDWSEWITFRNTSSEILRKITVDRFTILGNERRLGPISTLIPGDPPVSVSVSYVKRALELANVKLKAFNRLPVGVRMTVRYYGARDEPQHVAQYALIGLRNEVSIVPIIGDAVEWLDASDDAP